MYKETKHYNILTLQLRQKTVVNSKITVAVRYENGFAIVANRGVVLDLRYAFYNRQPRLA